jgi:hypothetical protein
MEKRRTQMTINALQLKSWRVKGLVVLRIVLGVIWAINAWLKWQSDFIQNITCYLKAAFVVSLPNTNLPIEAKLHFPRAIPAVLNTFDAVYRSKDSPVPGYKLVGLNGQPAEDGMVFPWQV